MPGEHLHFVTGRLAEFALRALVVRLAAEQRVAYTIDVLPITVAALMSPAWIAKHIQVPAAATRVILPGYCHGDLAPLTAVTSVPIQIGPRDLQQLPEFIGGQNQPPAEYGKYDIQVIAEINHAPRLARAEIIRQAKALAADGADLIDVGCDPDGPWLGVADCVRALRDEGLRVSIDSLDPREIAPAVRAGAELVLSVNSSNRAAACDWGCEVIVIPDDFPTLIGLEGTIELLAQAKVPLRVDAVLEPIGFGFAASLGRYLEVRRRYPDVEMLMGIGNLTELTDSDSAGINTLLLGFCQELGIRSVLTTQVINWARTSVRECNLARRLVYHAVRQHVPPKRLEPRLVTLRDSKLIETSQETLDQLAAAIKDNNFRIFAERGEIHVVSAGLHLSAADPFLLMERLLHPGFGSANDAHPPAKLDPSHAFYLGYEMCKAATALHLSKQYRQDEALDWGYLTVEEESHRLRKSHVRTEGTAGGGAEA